MERLGERWLARITVERGVVVFGLDYACAHIIIPASVNLLPIQVDFMTERVIEVCPLVRGWHCSLQFSPFGPS